MIINLRLELPPLERRLGQPMTVLDTNIVIEIISSWFRMSSKSPAVRPLRLTLETVAVGSLGKNQSFQRKLFRPKLCQERYHWIDFQTLPE